MTGGAPPDQASRAALLAFLTQHPETAAPGGLAAGPPARVARLDRPGAYLLIPIRDASGLRGIVQLDPSDLALESAATVRDPASPFLLLPVEAAAAAHAAFPAFSGWGQPFLAWRPCRESFSSFQPFWVVPHSGGQLYVSQSRTVHLSLSSGMGG